MEIQTGNAQWPTGRRHLQPDRQFQTELSFGFPGAAGPHWRELNHGYESYTVVSIDELVGQDRCLRPADHVRLLDLGHGRALHHVPESEEPVAQASRRAFQRVD